MSKTNDDKNRTEVPQEGSRRRQTTSGHRGDSQSPRLETVESGHSEVVRRFTRRVPNSLRDINFRHLIS